jgi:hypothetical protein
VKSPVSLNLDFFKAVDAAAVLSAKERLAPVVVIRTDEGTDDRTDDETDGWKGQSDTTASGQNQGYYISRYNQRECLPHILFSTLKQLFQKCKNRKKEEAEMKSKGRNIIPYTKEIASYFTRERSNNFLTQR